MIEYGLTFMKPFLYKNATYIRYCDLVIVVLSKCLVIWSWALAILCDRQLFLVEYKIVIP